MTKRNIRAAAVKRDSNNKKRIVSASELFDSDYEIEKKYAFDDDSIKKINKNILERSLQLMPLKIQKD